PPGQERRVLLPAPDADLEQPEEARAALELVFHGGDMRSVLKLLLLALAAYVCAAPLVALADEVTDDFDAPAFWRLKGLRVGAAKLRTSLANDPDTVWIGHIASSSYVPKDRNGNPVPSSARDANGAPTVAGTVPVGGYGPYHVGRGDNLPGGDVSQGIPGGAGTSFNGIW